MSAAVHINLKGFQPLADPNLSNFLVFSGSRAVLAAPASDTAGSQSSGLTTSTQRASRRIRQRCRASSRKFKQGQRLYIESPLYSLLDCGTSKRRRRPASQPPRGWPPGWSSPATQPAWLPSWQAGWLACQRQISCLVKLLSGIAWLLEVQVAFRNVLLDDGS